MFSKMCETYGLITMVVAMAYAQCTCTDAIAIIYIILLVSFSKVLIGFLSKYSYEICLLSLLNRMLKISGP